MSDEKKANLKELKVAPRFATPDMLELADQLDSVSALLREGKVPAAAVLWVEEKTTGNVHSLRHFAYEERLSALTGDAAALLAMLTDEMNRD